MKNLLVLAATAAASSSFAQVNFTGASYFQDFNTLSPTGAANPWSDNSTLLGWYVNAGTATYEADDGTSIATGMKSYGDAAGPQAFERALGSRVIWPATFSSGLRLTNISGNTLGSITLDYFGEQWFGGSLQNVSDVIVFNHSANATALNNGGWTNVSALNFTAPIQNFTGALNGNLAANRTLKSATISGLNWTNGTDMWLRWTHTGAERQGLAIDEVHITGAPVPEPFTMALAASALGLALRRRSAKVSQS